MNKEQLAQEIHHRLHDYYGEPDWRPTLSPVEELVSTILSQNTNDVNRDRAYDRLVAAFESWEDVRDAPPELVVEAVRVAGLANQKAPRIQEALKTITQERGEIELDFLSSLPTNQARKWLENMKGVGPKTAAIVLLFALDKPAFPVDTHVHRVTGRVGLRPSKMSAGKAHDYLAELFPEEHYLEDHLNIIRLGREICQARSPACPKCPLKEICHYFDEEYPHDKGS